MSVAQDIGEIGSGIGLLDRERTIARPGFNRWLVPPAALCVHLCIGMAYGFSVFWLPLTRAVGYCKITSHQLTLVALHAAATALCDFVCEP